MKKIFLTCLVALLAFANEYHDQDLDGVPDNLDRCPNTPFSDIVDEYGCSVERLIKPKRMEYYFEYIYAKDTSDGTHFWENDYLFSLTLYRGNFDLSFASLYYTNTVDHGFADTNVKLEYKFTLSPMWDLYVAGGVDLPTYNTPTNRADYDFYLSSEYYMLGYKILSGIAYTVTSDRYEGKKLKNSYSGYFGIEKIFTHDTLDLIYFYNRGKFGSVSNLAYGKLEHIFKGNYYIFATFSAALNHQTIDRIYSFGFGRRF